MSKCTAAQAVAAMEYWIGYREKASVTYSTYRDKAYFEKNAGSNNYTYAGNLCGVQGQPWCAAQDSTAIYEACGSNKADAKDVLWGVWPYINCAQVWDAAPDTAKIWSYHQRFVKGKGDRVNRYPIAGDIILFTNDQITRAHTGMVYGISTDKKYVYTIEGNSSNMCQKRSYDLTDKYIYGWIHPNYKASTSTVTTKVEQYGAVCCKDPELHILSKGTAGPEVESAQLLLIGRGFKCGEDGADGIFGPDTKTAVKAFQKSVELEDDGVIGAKTWPKLLKGGK
jgi:hypothetical protein